MKYRSIDERIVQSKSGNDQEWPKQEINKFEYHIEGLPYTWGSSSSSTSCRSSCCSIINCLFRMHWFSYTHLSIQKNTWTSHDDGKSYYFFEKTRLEYSHRELAEQLNDFDRWDYMHVSLVPKLYAQIAKTPNK